MTLHHDDDDDDEPTLPAPEVLDAWVVPPAAPDLADRVVDHVEAVLPSGPVVALRPRRRGGLGLGVVGVAMVAAAGLVLGLVQLSRSPTVDPVPPAAVTAPAGAPAVAPTPAPVEPPPVAVTPEDADDPSLGGPPPLRNPFDDGRVPGAHEHPDQPPRVSAKGGKDGPKDDAKELAFLRIGTMRGYAPAKIYVDGKYVGMTPLMKVGITSGRRHTVRWVWPDSDAELKVTLNAGETRTLKGPPGEDMVEPPPDAG